MDVSGQVGCPLGPAGRAKQTDASVPQMRLALGVRGAPAPLAETQPDATSGFLPARLWSCAGGPLLGLDQCAPSLTADFPRKRNRGQQVSCRIGTGLDVPW